MKLRSDDSDLVYISTIFVISTRVPPARLPGGDAKTFQTELVTYINDNYMI